MQLIGKPNRKSKTSVQSMGRWLIWLALVTVIALVSYSCAPEQTEDTDSQANIPDQTTRQEQTDNSPSIQTESDQATEDDDTATIQTDHETDQAVSESEQKGPYIKITPDAAKAWLDADDAPPLLDVRTPGEYAAGHIEGALLFPVGDLQHMLADIPADKDEPLIIYCRSGNRTLAAADILITAGFTQVYDLGGIIDWPYETVTD